MGSLSVSCKWPKHQLTPTWILEQHTSEKKEGVKKHKAEERSSDQKHLRLVRMEELKKEEEETLNQIMAKFQNW